MECTPIKRLLAALLALCLSTACASGPISLDEGENTDERAPDQEIQAQLEVSTWSEDRLELERFFHEYLTGHRPLHEVWAQGPEYLGAAAAEKSLEQEILVEDLMAYAQESGDDEVYAWAMFRIAQTELNFGCELMAIRAPRSMNFEEREHFEALLFEQIEPHLIQAVSYLTPIADSAIEDWSVDAQTILEAYEHVSPASCDITVEFWEPSRMAMDR